MFRAKEYRKVSSLEEAYELCQKRSSVVAGGMMWLKMTNTTKQTIVDLSGLSLDRIEETEEEFSIGAMTSLRSLETDKRLNEYFGGVFKECTRHIVGVQFRNGATVGGSIYGRFGFSDILTCMLALDSYVELYHGGIMPLADFAKKTPGVKERDILVRLIIKKDGRKAAYITQRQTKTDFPLIACCVGKKDGIYTVSVGARPAKAAAVELCAGADVSADAKAAADSFTYGDNVRGSGQYRRRLAEVYIRRLMEQLKGGEE